MEGVGEFLKCSICMDIYHCPRVLPCLHAFCHECLLTHSHLHCHQGGHAHFPCPTCREQVKLPPNGVQGFRHDFRIQQFLDWYKQASQNQDASFDVGKTDVCQCQICSANGKSRTAAAFCTNCQKDLCNKCVDRHVRKTIFSDHVITQAGTCQLGPEDLQCNRHRGEVISYICMKCNQGICGMCCMTTHDNHNILDYKMGVKCYRDNIGFLKKLVSARVGQLEQFLLDLGHREQHLSSSKADLQAEISERCELLVLRLRQQQEALHSQVEDHYHQDLTKLRGARADMEMAIGSMESLRHFTADLMKQKIALSLLPVYAELISRMDNLLEDSLQLRTHNPPVLAFTPSKAQLKLGKVRLVQDDTVKYLAPTPSKPGGIHKQIMFGNYPVAQQISTIGHQGSNPGQFDSPRDVAFLSSTSFIVADTANNRLQIFSLDGSLVQVLGQGQVKPWGVVVTSQGLIAVADALQKCVRLFKSDGEEVSHFGDFLCPCGIAVDREDNLVVTDFFSTSLVVMNLSGETKSSFDFRDKKDRHASGASRVAVSNHGNIIISDISNMCVKMFSSTGQCLHWIQSPDLVSSPHGVCVDVFDRVLVADVRRHQVVVVSTAGRLLHRLPLHKDGVQEPLAIALSLNGILLVTDARKNQVHVYKLEHMASSLPRLAGLE